MVGLNTAISSPFISIGLFVNWVDNLIDNIQNYENNDNWKNPRESGLEVKITLLFSSKLRRCCNIHLNILTKSTNFYIVNIHNIRMILIVLVLFTYFKNYFVLQYLEEKKTEQ